jgi:hypothetical protein
MSKRKKRTLQNLPPRQDRWTITTHEVYDALVKTLLSCKYKSASGRRIARKCRKSLATVYPRLRIIYGETIDELKRHRLGVKSDGKFKVNQRLINDRSVHLARVVLCGEPIDEETRAIALAHLEMMAQKKRYIQIDALLKYGEINKLDISKFGG